MDRGWSAVGKDGELGLKEHIPDRQRALERMISAVRPGGWLVLESIDFGGIMAAAMAHYADPPEHAPLVERMIRAIEAFFAAAGGDANFGSRLIRMLTDAGLANVAAEAHAPLVAGGTENWIPGTVEQLSERMVGAGLVTRRYRVFPHRDIGSLLPLRAVLHGHGLGPAPSCVITPDAPLGAAC